MVGGCIRKKNRPRAALGPPPKIAYNPMMGSRLDLNVAEEPEAVAAGRWRKARVDYLRTLLAGKLSPETGAALERELARLTSD